MTPALLVRLGETKRDPVLATRIEVEGAEYRLQPGDMIVVNPGALHKVSWDGEFLCRALTVDCGGPDDRYED